MNIKYHKTFKVLLLKLLEILIPNQPLKLLRNNYGFLKNYERQKSYIEQYFFLSIRTSDVHHFLGKA